MKGYLSIPDLRRAIEAAIDTACREHGVEANIRVEVTHPQRYGGRHGVLASVEAESTEGLN